MNARLDWKKRLKKALVTVGISFLVLIFVSAVVNSLFPRSRIYIIYYLSYPFWEIVGFFAYHIVRFGSGLIDIWIARAMGITVYALAALMLVGWLANIVTIERFFLKRKWRLVFFTGFWIVCIAMSFISKDVYFDQEGRPQKKYYKHSDGRIEFLPLELDLHPKYGELVQPVTPDVVKEAEKKKLEEMTEEALKNKGYRKTTIQTFPANADVYINLTYRGKTPLTITEQKIEGSLVVSLEGYTPQYREIKFEKSDTISLNLQPEETRHAGGFLLVVKQGLSGQDVFSNLRSELLKQKGFVTGKEEEQEFKQQLERAGGLSNQALLAWTRAKFGVDYLLFASTRYSITELGRGDVGYERIQQSLAGIRKNVITLDLEILDLKTGSNVSAFTSKAEDTSHKEMTNLSSLLQQVSSQSARRIKQEVFPK